MLFTAKSPWTNRAHACYNQGMSNSFPGSRHRLSLLLRVLLAVLFAFPAMAQDLSCPDQGLAETLSRFEDVYAQRRKMLVRCSVYAPQMEGKGLSMAALPLPLDPDLATRLTDADPANGELYGATVDYQDTLRLSVEVPSYASYQGLTPALDIRSQRYFFYVDLAVMPDQSNAFCDAEQAWCTDCK
ncbi:MAG: hypothetical protein KKB70_00060 [Proteobacteria bacterium]|nr:hypothetical protein [Pseudomonadota bacterium]MBU1611460.1 hypothetical protein [Pseudomonadota bacterium]